MTTLRKKATVILVVVSLSLFIAACGRGPGRQGQTIGGSPSGPAFRYHYAQYHEVSCWSIHAKSIFCIPDNQVTNPG